MKKKILLILLFLILLAACFFAGWLLRQPSAVVLKQSAFSQLPGWKTSQLTKSLHAFQVSCKAFLRQDPERPVGSEYLQLRAKDWHPVCEAALALDNNVSDTKAREFFQRWFKPVEFYNNKPVAGLFTGYYMPLLHGSLTPTKKYHVPIYSLPSNLIEINLGQFDPAFKNKKLIGRLAGNKIVPFYSREEINNGALRDKAKVLVWIDNPIDRVFLEIQGSGAVQLTNGERLYVGYSGENGAPYTAIAKVLIDKGVMTKNTASMQAIKQYLSEHPDEIDQVLNQNKSFVFFHILPHHAALGAQGVELTSGYSLAIDRKWIPLGVPLWLNTTRPDKHHDDKKVFQRLMIAQDTGGAIRGQVRGDVFWGAGKQATFIAGHMKNQGHYWLLLPRHAVKRLQEHFTA